MKQIKHIAILAASTPLLAFALGAFIYDFKPSAESMRDHLIGDWKTETCAITGKQNRVFQFAILRYRDDGLLETYSAEDTSGGALRFTNTTVMISKADLNPRTNVVFYGNELMCGSMFYGPISLNTDGFSQEVPPFGLVHFRRINSNEYERLKTQAMRIMDKKLQEIWRGNAPEDIRSAYIDVNRIAHGMEKEKNELAVPESPARPERNRGEDGK